MQNWTRLKDLKIPKKGDPMASGDSDSESVDSSEQEDPENCEPNQVSIDDNVLLLVSKPEP